MPCPGGVAGNPTSLCCSYLEACHVKRPTPSTPPAQPPQVSAMEGTAQADQSRVDLADGADGVASPTPKLPPLTFFGMIYPLLPPCGTAPSVEHPNVNPVPLTLGIWPDTDCTRQKNPMIKLIHAARENPFLPGRPAVVGELTAETATPCPSYTPEAIHFWFLWHNPFRVRLLEQFENQEIVMRTGHNLPSPLSKEVKVLLPFHALSKVCWGCGKWEQLEAPDERGARSYSRLKRCQGCRQSFFCGKKCQIKTWEKHKPHCEKMGEVYCDYITY